MMRVWLRFLTVGGCYAMLPACDGAIEDLRKMVGSTIMYTPASSMEPTMALGSRFTVYPVEAGSLQRGEVYIVQPNINDPRVLRLIGMPGDTVAVVDGALILNGAPVPTTAKGKHNFETREDGTKTANRLREDLPGSSQAYDVIDLGPSPLDKFGPVTLGPDQHFLLGDNRDNSADSRVDPDELGVSGIGLVSADAITHRVDMDSIAK